ncbi:hypothetical protein JG687_00019363 [Phytophthora cactorum]|uniref:Uncharacterized protein n=1 Tax=Phytophthora cactorum TaxID=29920 RepID=A0A8T1TN52_9STRA|nr:hypothetical protein JG687_00019363 [Phytophthora cactorum]
MFGILYTASSCRIKNGTHGTHARNSIAIFASCVVRIFKLEQNKTSYTMQRTTSEPNTVIIH